MKKISSKHGSVAVQSLKRGDTSRLEEGAPEEGAAAEASGGVVENSSVNGSLLYPCLVIFISGAIGLAFAAYLFYEVSLISVTPSEDLQEGSPEKASANEVYSIYQTIQEGAQSFLWAEYQYCFVFIAFFCVLIFVVVSFQNEGGHAVFVAKIGAITASAFLVGGLTSILSGYIGMMVAVYSNARTTISAQQENELGWTAAFNTAFRAGGVMGYSLVSISMMILFILILIFRGLFSEEVGDENTVDYKLLFECLAGYGLGGSTIALFGRVGGGIFTKAADVGADLSGKVIGVGDGKKLDEDSPYNPGVIADNVGDNVGDVAGMGSDLFGSFGEAACAAMLIGSACVAIQEAGWSALVFPLYISAVGILICLVCSFIATHLFPVRKEEDIELALKVQLVSTSVGLTVVLYPICEFALPATMHIAGARDEVTPLICYLCVIAGLWGGCIIGFVTEYYTSHTYQPVRDVARSTETGAATNIIYGLALGYQSTIIPVVILSGIIFVALSFAGMYGVALAALGMLSTLCTCLAIDVYGPISDNAGGIAEMSELPSSVRDKTDALDAAGNTTAAIGKGFAIGSAALVSLALFGAFITRVSVSMPADEALAVEGVNLLTPMVFATVLFGAMVPYWFSALTMRSVGEAANEMVKEIARQWSEIEGLKTSATMSLAERQEFVKAGGTLRKPDYEKCIAISTQASLREMIAPGLLVIATPIVVGFLFGVQSVAGLLTGAIVSSVQLAISMSNTGGAWDNAKKYCEKGELNGWFRFNDGTKDTGDFAEKAAKSSGNKCLTQYGATKEGTPIGDYLSALSRTNPDQYAKIMRGDEPVVAQDGRKCVFAGKRSAAHAAAVVGDTVGDPLKDTSGPALNIVMKLMAIISVVFADSFMAVNGGNGFLMAGTLHG
jgi:H+-translocating diphosphatase